MTDEEYQKLHDAAEKMVTESAAAYARALSSFIQLEMWQKTFTVFMKEQK